MSELMATEGGSLLIGCYPKWTSLDALGFPKRDIEGAMRQPDRISVEIDVVEVDGRSSRTVKKKVQIVPDQGLFGCEWTIEKTLKDFEKARKRLDSSANDYIAKSYDLWEECLQGEALEHWNDALAKQGNVAEADRTNATLVEAIQYYLEKLEGREYIGDALISQLRHARKPAEQTYKKFVARRNVWKGIINGPYVRKLYGMLSEQEDKDALFLAQPKKHQQAYCKEGKRRVTDSY